ncbi:hypothetical protein OROHE_006682 [Orobanche hederae]
MIMQIFPFSSRMSPWLTAWVLVRRFSRPRSGIIFEKQFDPSKETKLIRIRVQWIWFVPRNDNPDDFYSMQMILCDEEGGAVYDGCGDSHATCPLANIVNESSSSISDNVADTTPTDSYIKRRRLFSDEDLVVNTDADWESQHSTNVKDPAGVMKDATMLEDI